MIQIWQLQEAKNKLSQLIDGAINSGPQIITRHGLEVVIVLSYEEYKRMTAARQSLFDFFRQSPLTGIDLELTRDKSEARGDIQL
jgi:prevent-host-death family protein